jgi:uncharacterized membrane protein YhhN
MIFKPFRLLFLIAAIAEIASQLVDWPMVHWAAKPLLLIFLAAYYRQSVQSPNRFFFLALAFCWVGDVFLLFDHLNAIYFMAGLGSFLVAHLLFIFAYRQLRFAGAGLNGPQRARFSFPIILAGTGLVTVLYSRLGDLRIPVMIYSLALTLMVLNSIFRSGRTSAKSFWLVFFGAVFFMLSDSLLAINKFYQPIDYAGAWVITTYIMAVFFITEGAIFHSKNVEVDAR